ncbi:bone morphogenetic protein 2-like [Amphibalanus amphitrite]|uniref:bone morphogenetic protein 2-like n=1 Tax=Amphibalanus amphitrite TaxID=1232801 RepID=UPI001C90B799|nr:bone morphogenetic protein 2-like [Amphibalanus amphitrite]
MDASRTVVMWRLVLSACWVTGALTAPPRHTAHPASADVRRLAQALGFPEEVEFSHRRPPPPPALMVDLYNSVADGRGRWRGPTPYDANVVRSLREAEPISADFLQFDVAPFPAEDLLEAELHVYVSHVSHAAPVRRVRVSAGGGRTLDTALLPGAAGWAVLRVRPAVTGQGTADRRPLALSLTEETADGWWQRLNVSRRGHHHNRQPLLVLYSRDNRTAHHQTLNEELVRHARSASTGRRRRDADLTEIPSGCQRRELYIDFQEIGWSSFVVAPSGYDAYHCLGRCEFPLTQEQRPTNHATVQSLVEHMGLGGAEQMVQRPSCVPSALSSLHVLFLPDDNMVVLKKYMDMVAEECGCQ